MADKPLVDRVEAEIAADHANAILCDWIEQSDLFGSWGFDPVSTIAVSIKEFQVRGWKWDGRDLRKYGWKIWFRSQGKDCRPIIQWSKQKSPATEATGD